MLFLDGVKFLDAIWLLTWTPKFLLTAEAQARQTERSSVCLALISDFFIKKIIGSVGTF